MCGWSTKVNVAWGDQSGSGSITGPSAHLDETIEIFSFQPASLAHAHTWYFRGMSLVRLEIASAHLCLWTNTHTYVHKRRSVKGFRSHTASSDQACLEWSLPVSHAFLMLGSANRLEERVDRAGPLWPQSQSCLSPVPSTGDLCCFLITTVPMATPLCWLCFEHKLLLTVCYSPVSPSVYLQQMARPLCCSALSVVYAATCTYTHSLSFWRSSP